jgi:titin
MATAGNMVATVSWTAPPDNGFPITGYEITPYIGGMAQTPQDVVIPATTYVVTGLENGTTYTFTVKAANAINFGPESAQSNAVTFAATAPGPPTAVAASPGNAAATVSWTAPLANGSPISSYVVTPYIAGVAQSPQTTFMSTATTYTLSGLSNGTAYTFTVAGVNSLGEGTQSAATTPVTVGAPGAPTGLNFNGVTQPGGDLAVVTWTAPPANGSPITGYVITLSENGGSVVTSQTFNSPATSETVGPLTAGDNYEFAVAAVNSFGQGPEDAVTNEALIGGYTVPGAPTGVSASAGTAQATVSWTPAPAYGSPATGFVITPYIAGVAQTPQTFNSTATTETVVGLTSGTTYTFTVAGTNFQGQGPDSAQSNAVTIQ